MQLIKELTDGLRVNGQYLVSNSAKCINNNGSFYLNMELRDATGSIAAKKWEVNEDDEKIFVTGNVVYIDGEVVKYKDALQLKVLTGKPLDISEVDTSRFVKGPPIPKDELIAKFNTIVASIKDTDCHKLVDYFISKYSSDLYTHPAGVNVHHEYSSGLLVHITTMCELGSLVAKLYDGNYDLLMAGIILHDFGKMKEFTGPIIFKYSTEGKLLGHISIMVSELKEAANKLGINSEVPLLLEHMILSHHGEPEFGSPVRPLTKEAMMLSLIDNLDSKMVITNKALEDVLPGEFSSKVFPLDSRCLYKPKA